MSVLEFMASLATQGVKIWTDDGHRLRYRAPKNVMTASLLAKLREYKAELLTILSQHHGNGLEASLPQVVPAPTQLYQPFPITETQQAYWIGRNTVFELGNVGNHCYVELEALEWNMTHALLALQRLIARHPMLRAVILSDGEQQILEQVPPYCIECIDLQGLTQPDQERQLQRIRDEMGHYVYQVEQWPAFTMRVARLHKRCFRIQVSMEALFADSWSMLLLIQEFVHLYHEPEASLPPLNLSFRDYVLAEAQLQASELYERSRDYWLARIPTLPAAPDLPHASDAASLSRPRFVPRNGRMEAAQWQRLKARGAQAGLTPSGILLAAFAEVLAVWSKKPHFCINLTLFNRLPLHEQVNEIVGDFTSLLILEIDNAATDLFEQRARRLQERLWQDADHRLYSGVHVLRDLARQHGSATQALMPVVFTSVLGQQTALTHPTPWQEIVYFVTQTPQVWLDHQVMEQAGNLVFYWQVVEELFPVGLIDEMFDAYTQLLQRLASEEEVWQSYCSELLPASQQTVRAHVNETSAPISDALLQNLFLQQARLQPDQLAIISARRALTYQEVLNEAILLAHRLRQLGACPNQLIAVVMEKGWEQVVAVLGILFSGAAYLPLDPVLPQERLTWLLEHGAVEVVLTQSWLNGRIAWPKDVRCICVDSPALNETIQTNYADQDNHETVQGNHAAQDNHTARGYCGKNEEVFPELEALQGTDDLAYVIYTSGSTGLPKGVMISHRAAVNTILDINRRFAVGSTDRVFALSALHFDLSVYDIFGLLAAGGTIVLPPAGSQRDPALWLELLLRERVTLWNSVPALLEMLLALGDSSALSLQQSRLRLALISGDWIPLSLPAHVKESVPTLQLISLGGATEASIWSILYPIEDVEASWKSIPYGKPLCNQRFHVLNEKLEPCPVWVAGQLYIGGVGLARGYWRDEAKTQASFLIHPHIGERLYRTGDMGRYWPDGTIEFLGREDFQVKIAGHRIELGEIEAALLEHPAVSNAVVTATGKPFEHKHLIAYVVATRNGTHPTDNPQENTNWQVLVTKSQHYIQALPDADIEDTFLELWQILEQMYLQIVCKALQDFAVFRSSDERYTVDELMQHCGIHPCYQQWVTRNLRLLAHNGYLQEQHGSFKCERPLPDRTLDAWCTIYQQAASRLTDPTLLALGWHKRFPLMSSPVAENLKSVLTEELHSAEINLSAETRAAYRIFHTSNTILQIIVQEVVELTAEHETLRILEIRASIGTATAYLLPILPPSRTEYSYTDISTYFLQEAQEEFAAYPFVKYRLLDIEKNPQAQGYEMHGFDIIIAASTLHMTANIAETLKHVRSLLKPRGILLLLEQTKFHPIFDLTMGLQQGFDRFADTELRQVHPLLTRDMWYEVLTQQGFSSAEILNKAGTLNQFFGFDIVLAQGPATVALLSLTELFEHLRSKLPEYMHPLSIIPLETLPLTANGKVDRQALPHPLLQSQKPASSTKAAHTPVEKKLVQIWCELLSLSNVGVEDDFLQLGGDSLLALKVLAHIRANFNVEIPFPTIFKKPTIAALAEMIAQYAEQQRDPLASPFDASPLTLLSEQMSRSLVVSAPDQTYLPFPLSDVQQAYWIGRHASFALGNVGNHCYIEVEALDLDVGRSLLAVRRLIVRHAMLRAVILPNGEQQVLEQVPLFSIECIDLQRLHTQHQDEQLQHIRDEMDHYVYQVEQWPTFTLRVSRLHKRRVRMHVSAEILFADAWSMVLIVQEFVHLYHEPEASLPRLDLSFRDYIFAEAQLQASEQYERSRDYWLARIPTLPAAPDLPHAIDAASLSRPRFVPRNGRMEATQWQRLKARGAQAGLTPSGILLAAFAEVLAVWSKTPRFCINLTLFNRLPLHKQVNEIVGDFTSLLLLQVDYSLPDLFEQRARRLQERLWQDVEHRLYSGVHVLRDLARQHGSATQALMPVVFTSVLGQQTALTHPIPWQEIVYTVTQTPQVWLDHQVMEQAGNLVFYWQVVEELFPVGLIDEMFDAYTQLLQRLASEEEVWQSYCSELVPTSQQTVRAHVNETSAPISDALLQDLFLQQARLQPDQLAIISARRALTYQEVLNEAILLAHRLRQLGACPNQLIAVVMEKGWEQVVAVLGILFSGAAYLPLDPALPQERLTWLLEHGAVEVVLTQSWLNGRIAWSRGMTYLCIDHLEVSQQALTELETLQGPDDLAYVIYTSGSTGLPKGVMISHRAAVNTILDINRRFAVSSTDRVLALSALHFDLSVYDIFGLLAAGGTIVLPPAGSQRDPALWLELLLRERVTLWNSVPALLEMLLALTSASPLTLQQSRLRLALISGDWIPLSLPARIKKSVPTLQLISLGGATEASIWSILYPIENVEASWKSIPYGKPLCNQHFHVLNEKLEPCPVWVAGQLYIGGIGLARGYWRDEAKTQASFLIHPHTGQRLYRTGDMGRYWPDGNIEFLGREDLQVKVRGHRIELGEIEQTLLQHPAVQAAVAAVITEARGDKRLVAYVTLQSGPIPQEKRTSHETLHMQFGQASLRKDVDKPTIELVRPTIDADTLRQYQQRLSYRQFLPEPLSFKQLSAFLQPLSRIELLGLPKYLYPSAGSIYPVQTYLSIQAGRVEGLAEGVYYYNPELHQLLQLSAKACIERGIHDAINQAIFDQTACSLFFIADLTVISQHYGNKAHDFCLLEAGYMGQLLMMTAAEHRIGLCPIGGLDFAHIREAFALGENHILLHSFLCGGVDPDVATGWSFLPIETGNAVTEASAQSATMPTVLRSFLIEKLPEYLIPSVVVVLDSLPLTANGKVDRQHLLLPDLSDGETVYIAPTTQIEQQIATIWQEVLGLEKIGLQDNFFAIGGNSLMAVRILNQLRKIWGSDLSPITLPTIASMAEVLKQTPALPSTMQEIARRERQKDAPLSFAQQRLWFLNQLQPESTAYLSPYAISLCGPLHKHALEQSLEELCHRHEVLRTTFEEQAAQPVQVIHTRGRHTLPLVDLRRLTPGERKSEVQCLIYQETQKLMKLAQGPLLRTTLLWLDSQEAVLLLTMHHIISDARSQGVFVEELTTCYTAFSAGIPAALPELPIQYADFAVWQREWVQKGALEHQLAYWLKKLDGLVPLELPTDHPRPLFQTFRGAHQSYSLSPSLLHQLKGLSRQEQTTLFMTVLAVFLVLLFRYTGQTDIAVGTTLADRPRSQVEGLIGFFVNMLVMRASLSHTSSFRQLLASVRTMVVEALANQDIPFEELVARLQPARQLNRTPFFQIEFTFHHPLPTAIAMGDLVVTSLPLESGNAKFDLTVEVAERKQGLEIMLEYNTDLFEAGTIERLMGAYKTLLEGVVANPEQCIADLPVLTENERHQMLLEWNATSQSRQAPETSFHYAFEAQVERTPDRLAIVAEDDQLTYDTLNSIADRVAYRLQKAGVAPEVLVALLAERGINLLIAILSTFKAGGAYLPLDPHSPPERIAQVLHRSASTLVLTTHSQHQLLLRALAHSAETREVVGIEGPGGEATLAGCGVSPNSPIPQKVLGFCNRQERHTRVFLLEDVLKDVLLQAGNDQQQLSADRRLDYLAYVIFTSGSTGDPKGAMVEQRGMLNHLHAKIAALQLCEQDSIAQTASQGFDISVWQMLAALLVGGRTVIYSNDLVTQQAALIERMQRDGITIFETVPSLLRTMLDIMTVWTPQKREPLSLRWLIATGEALPSDLCHKWLAHYGDIALLNAYGPTECSDDVTHYQLRAAPHSGHVPIGRPILNMQMYVLNPRLVPVPIGVAGELYVGGIGVGRGYVGDPQQTAEAFLPDPFVAAQFIAPGARLYKTGDLVRYLSDGTIEFLGRIDHQVKVRGYRIELGEVEAILLRHEAIQAAVVLAREDSTVGKYLVAYVVGNVSKSLAIDELRRYLQEKLPDYMVPAFFVPLDALPLTPHGKVDRHALPMPEQRGEEAVDAQFIAPGTQTPIEEIVLGLYCEILGVGQISIHESFFDLGGHSLLATQVISRIRAAIGVELSVRSLFETPSVAGLAREIARHLCGGEERTIPPLVPVLREQDLPLSFAQQRLWVQEQLVSDRSAYVSPVVVRLHGPLHVAVLEQCLQAMVRRHESLRTTFVAHSGQPIQVIHTDLYIPLTVIDLQMADEKERAREVFHLLSISLHQPFALSQGPLLRIGLFRLQEQEHIFCMMVHHIVFDGWSMSIFLHELSLLYRAFLQRRPSPLPPLTLQYADVALWQRDWLKGEVLDRLINYWSMQLAGAVPLQMPTDRPRGAIVQDRGALYPLMFSAPLGQELLTLSREVGVTLFMTLLTAFNILLYRWTRQQDIVVGTDIANRTQASTEQMIGFFVNLLPLRIRLSAQATFREIVRQVCATVLDAYAHQDLPFDKLVEALQLERKPGQIPLINVLFVLNNMPQPSLTLPNVAISPVDIEVQTAKFDVALFLMERGEEIVGYVNYRTELFDAESIAALVRHFEVLLHSIVAAPETAVELLEMLTAQEKEQACNSERAREQIERRELRRSKRQVIPVSVRH